ncbi:hypothetical protein PCANC_28645, partial [Puccinia coronata f. sp. avenae]
HQHEHGRTLELANKMGVMNAMWMLQQQVRRFTSGTTVGFPLQPLKQRKTVPIRNPRRPHLPDPVDTDPTAQRFKLAEHPRVLLVIREPSGVPNLADQLISPPPVDPKNIFIKPRKTSTEHDATRGLSHPVLSPASSTSSAPSSSSSSTTTSNTSSGFQLPPRLRAPKVSRTSLTPEQAREVQKLRATHSVSQLSRKFSIPRILVSILGPTSDQLRHHIQLRNQMRQARKEARWSIPKVVRRHEKMARRSAW